MNEVVRPSNERPQGPLWIPTAQVERMMRECRESEFDTVGVDRKTLEGLLYDSLLWRQERAAQQTTPVETNACAHCREVYEIWASSEGMIPETAPEAYLSRVMMQMRDAAAVGMFRKVPSSETCDVICPATSPPAPHRFGPACIYCGTPKSGVERAAATHAHLWCHTTGEDHWHCTQEGCDATKPYQPYASSEPV